MSIYGNPVMLGGSGGGGGGGSTNVLSGTTTPTAAQGQNGAIYLKYIDATLYGNVAYIKFTITATRASSQGMQLSLVELLDDSDSVVPWPSGTTVSSNAPAYASSEGPDKLISSTSTKYYTATNPSANSPIEIVFDLGTTIGFNKWRWYTANDSDGRDPTSFSLSVSVDGTTYTELDSQTITPTTNRQSIAYTSNIVLFQGGITDTYAKVNGAWQNLIGTDINDIDLGS